jgi:hypothetical protein
VNERDRERTCKSQRREIEKRKDRERDNDRDRERERREEKRPIMRNAYVIIRHRAGNSSPSVLAASFLQRISFPI